MDDFDGHDRPVPCPNCQRPDYSCKCHPPTIPVLGTDSQRALKGIERVVDQDRASGGNLFLLLDDDIATIRAALAAVQAQPIQPQPLPDCNAALPQPVEGASALQAEPAGQLGALTAIIDVVAKRLGKQIVQENSQPAEDGDDEGQSSYLAGKFGGINAMHFELHKALAEAQVPAGTAGEQKDIASGIAAELIASPARPDLASLKVWKGTDIRDDFAIRHEFFYRASDVERLLNPTGETK